MVEDRDGQARQPAAARAARTWGSRARHRSRATTARARSQPRTAPKGTVIAPADDGAREHATPRRATRKSARAARARRGARRGGSAWPPTSGARPIDPGSPRFDPGGPHRSDRTRRPRRCAAVRSAGAVARRHRPSARSRRTRRRASAIGRAQGAERGSARERPTAPPRPPPGARASPAPAPAARRRRGRGRPRRAPPGRSLRRATGATTTRAARGLERRRAAQERLVADLVEAIARDRRRAAAPGRRGTRGRRARLARRPARAPPRTRWPAASCPSRRASSPRPPRPATPSGAARRRTTDRSRSRPARLLASRPLQAAPASSNTPANVVQEACTLVRPIHADPRSPPTRAPPDRDRPRSGSRECPHLFAHKVGAHDGVAPRAAARLGAALLRAPRAPPGARRGARRRGVARGRRAPRELRRLSHGAALDARDAPDATRTRASSST